VPELQKRGIYWSDYAVPGGTARENLHNMPGERLLAPEHPGAKMRWNAPKATEAPKEEVVAEAPAPTAGQLGSAAVPDALVEKPSVQTAPPVSQATVVV
jgi:hypothetical protein